MRKSKLPIFIEDSKVPKYLSYIAPIDIYAINVGLWVWCRYKMNVRQKQHETIHFQQQLELGFLFFFFLYLLFWLIGFIKWRNGVFSYRMNPFEREAYDNDIDPLYLQYRKRYKSWARYIPNYWR